MFGFHLDYLIFCVISVSGVLINVSAYRRPSHSFSIYIMGSSFIVVGALLFFLTDNRTLNDHEGGLDANEQAILFPVGGMIALGLHKAFVAVKRLLDSF